MYREALRVLVKGGKFVAFLTAFDSVMQSMTELGVDFEVDADRLAVKDTTGWQCFHTPQSIDGELREAGFAEIKIRKVELSSSEEIAALERLYGVDTSSVPVFEYLASALKPA